MKGYYSLPCVASHSWAPCLNSSSVLAAEKSHLTTAALGQQESGGWNALSCPCMAQLGDAAAPCYSFYLRKILPEWQCWLPPGTKSVECDCHQWWKSSPRVGCWLSKRTTNSICLGWNPLLWGSVSSKAQRPAATLEIPCKHQVRRTQRAGSTSLNCPPLPKIPVIEE